MTGSDLIEGLSHRIEAGCDFYVMPSRFEPCGLNQMVTASGYGTVPIVRITGGLERDTVVDITENAATASGIKFQEYSARALAKSLRKALALFEDPKVAADLSQERHERRFFVGHHDGPVYPDICNRCLTRNDYICSHCLAW